MLRTGKIGFYREYCEYYQKTGQSAEAIPVPTYEPESKTIRFKYLNGYGLSKEEFILSQTFIYENGGYVIETKSEIVFSKGDKLVIDGGECIITKIQQMPQAQRLNGRKKLIGTSKVIYCG